MKIIDCHTHLQTKELIEEYFSRSSGYVISIKALDFLIGNGDEFYDAIKDYKNVFICECIDALLPIDKQLEKIEKNLKKYQVVGLKIYLGYQPVFANDERFYPVYEFAKKNGLSVVFHCGVGAENLDSEEEVNYASSLKIVDVAKKFPEVNFIASHFDYPNIEDCAKIVMEHKNIFTDISGIYENFENKDYKELINWFVNELTPVINKYDKNELALKVMFGTDYFGIGSGFDAIDEYKQTIVRLFGEKNYNNCVFKNCMKAYPKLNKYLTKESKLVVKTSTKNKKNNKNLNFTIAK